MWRGAKLTTAVVARESGRSSTPRLLDSIINVSGILGRPVKPDDDSWAQFRDLAAGFSREVCS
jgi:hypothetical protein